MNPTNKEITFSPLIIGTMRLGVWGVKMTTTELEKFVAACIELGLTDFDHADIYGHYTTEDEFGKVLKNQPSWRQKIQLTTKCGIKLTSENRSNHKIKSYDSTKAHIIASAEYSLKALETDYIDVLLLHRPDYLMNPHDIAEAAETLKKDGKIKHFGVSNYTASQFDLLNSYTPLITNQIELSILHLNALDDGTLDQCIKNNINPTAWSPFGGGSIFQNSEVERNQRIQKVANALAEKHNASLEQILLAFLLKHPSSIIPVLGTSKIERIKNALNATKINLTHEEWYELLEASKGHEVA